jgi:hypothetical protein
MQVLQFHLVAGDTIAIRPHKIMQLCVLSGWMHVTLEGDRKDYFLSPGQVLTLNVGRVVLSAERDDSAIYVLEFD